MRPTTSSTCASAASWSSLPRSTSFLTCPLGDLARLGEPGLDELVLDVLQHDGDARGGDGLGDLAAHGSGADDGGLEDEHVLTCAPSEGGARQAIWPPSRSAPQLAREAAQRPLERLALRAAHEQQVERAELPARLLERVVELERHGHAVARRARTRPLRAADLLVLDRDRLPDARLVAGDLLEHAAAPAGERVPDDVRAGAGQSPSTRATCLQPSTKVGQRRWSYQSASASLAGRGRRSARRPAPRASDRSSRRMRSIPAATASRRGPSSTASRSRSPRPPASGGRSAASGARGAPTRPARGPAARASAAADTSCSG